MQIGANFYFGNIDNGLRKGFSYQQLDNRSVLIGEFANSKLVNGFSKEYINGNKVQFYRTLNGKKVETESQNFFAFDILFKPFIGSNINNISTTSSNAVLSTEIANQVSSSTSVSMPYSSNPIIAEADKFFIQYFNDSLKILGIKNQLTDKQIASNTLGPDKVEKGGEDIYVFDKEENKNQSNKGIKISDDKYGHKVFLGVFSGYEFKVWSVFWRLSNMVLTWVL